MLQLLVGFVGILIGTLTDLKTREVPDWVNYSLIGSGVGIATIETLYEMNYLIILFSLAGLLAGFLVGALMYYTAQWGGGDAKMIMGLGALIGLPFLPRFWDQTPFLVVFLLFTVLAGAAYGLLWMIGLVIVKRKVFWPEFKKRMHEPKLIKIRIFIIIIAVVIVAAGLAFPRPFTILALLIAALTYLTFYLTIAVKIVEKTCFIKKISVDKLVEGDWTVGEIKSGKKVLVPDNNPGLTKKQISAIQKAKIKKITVKEGIPFVPSFLFAYIIAWVWWQNDWPLIFWI